MQHQVVAVLVFSLSSEKGKIVIKIAWFTPCCVWSSIYHIVYELRPMPSHSFDSLKHVHLAVLDDLLYAGIGGTVHTGPAATIAGRKEDY